VDRLCNLCGKSVGGKKKYCCEEHRLFMKKRPKGSRKKENVFKRITPKMEKEILKLLKVNWTDEVIASFVNVEDKAVLERRLFYGIERYDWWP